MVSIKLKLSTKQRYLNGVATNELLMRLSIDRTHVYRIKTGIFIPSSNWDEKIQRVKIPRVKTTDTIHLVRLQESINKLVTSVTDFAIKTPVDKLTKTEVEELVATETGIVPSKPTPVKFPPSQTQSNFFSVLELFIKSKCVGRRIEHFESLWRILLRFEGYKGKNYQLTFDGITPDTLAEFKTFLEIEHTFFTKGKCIKHARIYNEENFKAIPKQRGGNAIHSLLKKLRTFILWAVKSKKTTNNPFTAFKLDACVYGTPFYLTSEERNLLYAFTFEEKSLAVQRDIFVLQSNLGMRYGDFCELTHANIVAGAIEYVANKNRNKTGQTIRVPLTSQAKDIINRYKDYDRRELMPFISQQKYNVAIKKMLKLAGIDRTVTVLNPTTRTEEQRPIYEVASSHMARRNFIGNLYNKTQDPNAIGSMTGHVEGSKAFARYRAIDDSIKRSLIDQL